MQSRLTRLTTGHNGSVMNPTLAPEAPAQVKPDGFTLPSPRGPISERLLESLRAGPSPIDLDFPLPDDALSDDDLHLALYVCYELHYRGFAGVDPRWEWEPGLIAFRNRLERPFEEALIENFMTGDDEPVVSTIKGIARSTQGPSLSSYISDKATYEEFLE